MPTFWHLPLSLISSLLSTFTGLLLYTRHISEPVHSLVGEVGMQVNCDSGKRLWEFSRREAQLCSWHQGRLPGVVVMTVLLGQRGPSVHPCRDAAAL